MRLILIEDQPELALWLTRALVAAGYVVDTIADGLDADFALKREQYDLAILDMNLPRLSGEAILQRLRARKQTLPVLVLTARGGLSDKVRGLEMGADDYLVKPFELDELEARIKALLRRHRGHESTWLSCGDLRYHPLEHYFELGGKLLVLTRREQLVLAALMKHSGHPLNRERLFNQVFGMDDEVNPEAIEVYISRLRKKLDGSVCCITTLRGLGYLLETRHVL